MAELSNLKVTRCENNWSSLFASETDSAGFPITSWNIFISSVDSKLSKLGGSRRYFTSFCNNLLCISVNGIFCPKILNISSINLIIFYKHFLYFLGGITSPKQYFPSSVSFRNLSFAFIALSSQGTLCHPCTLIFHFWDCFVSVLHVCLPLPLSLNKFTFICCSLRISLAIWPPFFAGWPALLQILHFLLMKNKLSYDSNCLTSLLVRDWFCQNCLLDRMAFFLVCWCVSVSSFDSKHSAFLRSD